MLRSRRLSSRGVPTLHTDAVGAAPPDAFGPFRVLHQIGVGSLGPVYRAYQPELDRLVAVKTFHLDLAPENALRFVAELEKLIAADLTHPGIAAPLGTGMAGPSPYLAQDFVAADSLDVAIGSYGPAPLADAVRVAAQLAGALDFAARENIVHGALHPRDVLISPDDARLTGLGITRALELIGAAGPVRLPYTAPERAAGESWDRRADVFSLATLVFELLWARQVPGSGRMAAEAIAPVPGGDTARLRQVFERALADDPADRFDTALAFAEALKACVADDEADLGPLFTGSPDDRGTRLAPESDPLASFDSDPTTATTPDRDPAAAIAREFPFLEASSDSRDTWDGLRLSLDAAGPSAASEPARPELRSHDLDFDGVAAPGEERASLVEPITTAKPVEHDLEPAAPPVRVPLAAPPAAGIGFSEYAAERSRSAVWPLMLAVLVGVAVGTAATFLLVNRDHPGMAQTGPATDVATGSASTQAPSGATPPPPPRETIREAVPRPAPDEPPAARPAPPRPPESTTARERVPAAGLEPGRLLVRSTPAGARVTVDGRNIGSTPVTVRDLDPGPHTVRLARDGYLEAERRVTISSTRPAPSVTVALARAPEAGRAAVPVPSTPSAAGRSNSGKGLLFVESRPVSATVFVDDKMVGTTPLQMDSLEAGSHVVRMELTGYKPWSSAVRVAAGERLRVSASLER